MEAILAAAEAAPQTRGKAGAEGAAAMSEHDVVGRRVRKVDGVKLVTGKTAFTDDIELPGLLIGKILGSPHAHARIRQHRHAPREGAARRRTRC